MSAPSLNIVPPPLVLVAAGESQQAQANARGHLFERLVARVFEAYGCDKPTTQSLNVRSDGYELDISTRITLTREDAIAECKAYSSRLPSSALNAFYGKLSSERLDRPGLHGWFVAMPGLTSEGDQLARKLVARDKSFRYLTADEIYDLLIGRQWIRPVEDEGASDHGVVVASSGMYAVAKRLDPNTRLASAVILSGPSPAPSELIELLAETDYVGNLPILDFGRPRPQDSAGEPQAPVIPTLVTVSGSTDDFEYQLPASPRFFIGRVKLVASVRERISGGGRPLKVIVLNAQSGWGKSSLALRLGRLAEAQRGYAAIYDSRTATTPEYVWAAIREALIAAGERGLVSLPKDASFASLASALQTVRRSQWLRPEAPLLVFFDQFENVFRDVRLTQEFRDLALAVREISHPFTVGFAWKTDLVGWTEKYPYQLRDEIRAAAEVINVTPFGPSDVGTLLTRLSKASGAKLSGDLRQRLREYSQGLPWLLKKLASHILKELQSGTSEATLIQESLNVQALFENDLAGLQVTEIEALKLIAREAPVPVVDVVERVPGTVVQSLVDQRLLVRVGERLDVYWDIFREFLITGKLSVEETYILRLNPLSTSNVLRHVVDAGGEVPSGAVATALKTSQNTVFNAARELRQLGILAPRQGIIALTDDLRVGPVTEQKLQSKVAAALRRHRVFHLVQELMRSVPSGTISVDELASALPAVFPAVQAKNSTWKVYATAFANWFGYGGVFELRGQTLRAGSGVSRSRVRLLGGVGGARQKTFPQARPAQALSYLEQLLNDTPPTAGKSTREKVTSDLIVLGVLDSQGAVAEREQAEALVNDTSRERTLRVLIERVPAGAEALALLESSPAAPAEAVGEVIRDGYGLPWAAATVRMAGSTFRAWASAAGVRTAKVRRRSSSQEAPNEIVEADTLVS